MTTDWMIGCVLLPLFSMRLMRNYNTNETWHAAAVHWATSLFGLVFRSVPNSDSAKVKPKSEVDFFVRTQLRTERKTELIVWSEVRTESEVNLNYSDSVQLNLHTRDRLIPYRLTFTERKTTSLFRLVKTNWIAKKSDLSSWRNHY